MSNPGSFLNQRGARLLRCCTFPVSVGPKNAVFSPHNLAKNLTPSLLKARMRFETLSAGSTTTDTEGGVSPLWESEEVSNHKSSLKVDNKTILSQQKLNYSSYFSREIKICNVNCMSCG